jgi:predicted ribosome quality control (RQC) complex YloA/Tae2 family protein
MTFDTWTTAAVADELRQTIVSGRVQQVLQVDEESFALEVYADGQRRYLLVSANRQAPRLHLLTNKPRRGVDTPSPLLQLLRKFVRGAALTQVTQPPWERILLLRCEHPELGTSALMAELIGRWANLLLLRPAGAEEGADAVEPGWPAGRWRIMDCVHRLKPEEAADGTVGARASLPGHLYTPPPALTGCPPDELTEASLRQLWEQSDPKAPAWRVLVQGVSGMSPLLAREVVWRAVGDAQAKAAQAPLLGLVEAIAPLVAILQEGAWQPCIITHETGLPAAFAPYPLGHRAGSNQTWLRPVESISAAAESFYENAFHTQGDPYAAARQQVAGPLGRTRAKLLRRHDAIASEVRPADAVDALRTAGEWILALASQIKPRQSELRLPAEAGGATVKLDPALSPADNAAVYFKRYRKARRAGESAVERLSDVKAELAYVDQLSADLALAADRSEIDAVRAALVESGYARPPSRKTAPSIKISEPRRFTTVEGFTILVGRNSRQNEQVTFDLARPDDLWLHARGWPGAHVVLRNGGQSVSNASLQQAAALAAFYSGGRAEGWVDVIVTERRRVRRAPGKRPGMVVVEEERVLRVRPQAPAT